MTKEETLLEFPCPFSIKAMGLASVEFEEEIYQLLKTKLPYLKKTDITNKTSKTGKYHSLSIKITATSKAQLDELYQMLSDCPSVAVAL